MCCVGFGIGHHPLLGVEAVMRVILAAAMMVWSGAAAAAEMREVTPASYAAAHRRNSFAAEADLTGKPFRFVGVPVQVGRGPNGLPMLHYEVSVGLMRVQAILARDAAASAAGIEVGRRIALICDTATWDLFPQVTGCRPEAPVPTQSPR